ncbi:hypothetical protein ACFUC1_13780, partial [Pedococcus sp. NPDC057267]|uniref:hypothetical protein n=1 Tax=Pedococcus sp. NPDC057267 TaxID=3346077 RepID=UPI0036314505
VLGAAPAGPANGTDALVARLDAHAAAVAPRYLEHVRAVVTALCEPPAADSPGPGSPGPDPTGQASP